MIDVKQIGKPKTNTGNGGGSTTVVSVSKVAEEAGYASRAGRADKAAYADISNYATTSAQSTRANYASVAGELSEDSDVYDKFIRKDIDDSAKGVITFLKGLLLGDGTHGITEEGAATLASVISERWGISAEGAAELVSLIADSAKVETVESQQMCDDIANAIANRTLVGADGYEMYVDASGKSHLWVDELMVRVKAYFASLEIRKVSYSGGTTIFSNAGSTIVKVAEITSGGKVVAYKCYAKADDGTTKTMNWWRVGMQALCQTFNVSANTNGNKYYWRLVTGVGQETLSDGYVYDYVILSNLDTLSAGTQVPTYGEAEIGSGEGDAWQAIEWGENGVVSVTQSSTTAWGYDGCRGYDTSSSDIPEPYDVIVQVGDQLNPTIYGNVVKIATSRDDSDASGSLSEATAPAIDMYYAISDFSWSSGVLTAHIAPNGVYFNAQYFKFYSGNDYTAAKPMTMYMGVWDSATTYYYLQQVTYEGQIWTYNSESGSSVIGAEPSEANGWILSVAKGEDGDSITFVVSPSAVTAPQSEKTQTVGIRIYAYRNGEAILRRDYTGTIGTLPDGVTRARFGSSSMSYQYLVVTVAAGYSGTILMSFTLTIDGKDYDMRASIYIAEPGEKGADGTSVTIKGTLASTDDLASIASPTNGDGYLIDGYLYVYTGSGEYSGFTNVGKIQGEKGDSVYLHIAYANDADGTDFSHDYSGQTYIGYCADSTKDDSGYTYDMYAWRRFVGEKGDDGADAWSVRATPAAIALSEDDLTEGTSGSEHIFKPKATQTIILSIMHGDKEVTSRTISNAQATNCVISALSTSSAAINAIKGYRPTDADGNYLRDSDGNVIWMPYGSASFSCHLKATDGSSSYEADVSCAISVSYAKQMASLYVGQSEIRSTVSSLSTSADAMQTRLSEVEQTADKVSTRVSAIEGDYVKNADLTVATDKISATITNGLTKSGIDIEAGTVTAKTDTFKVENVAGEVTAKVNANGQLEVADGIFNGTIKARNFYHGVCYNTDDNQMAAVYKTNDDGTASVIAYVSQEEAMTTYAEYNWEPCIGTADIVIVNADRTIALPRAKDFVGKVIEVYDASYTAIETDRIPIGIVCNNASPDDGLELFGMGLTDSGRNVIGGAVSAYMTTCYMSGGMGSMARFIAMELPGYVGADYSKYWWIELTGNITNVAAQSDDIAVASEEEKDA